MKTKGFTLVEILTAVAITGAGLIIMMNAWTNIQKMASSQGSIAYTGRLRAQIVMEDVVDDVIRGQEINYDFGAYLN